MGQPRSGARQGLGAATSESDSRSISPHMGEVDQDDTDYSNGQKLLGAGSRWPLCMQMMCPPDLLSADRVLTSEGH